MSNEKVNKSIASMLNKAAAYAEMGYINNAEELARVACSVMAAQLHLGKQISLMHDKERRDNVAEEIAAAQDVLDDIDLDMPAVLEAIKLQGE